MLKKITRFHHHLLVILPRSLSTPDIIEVDYLWTRLGRILAHLSKLSHSFTVVLAFLHIDDDSKPYKTVYI